MPSQELCEGGDYFQRLLAHGTYSEVQAAATTRTILETLSYCHSLGVVHRWPGARGGMQLLSRFVLSLSLSGRRALSGRLSCSHGTHLLLGRHLPCSIT